MKTIEETYRERLLLLSKQHGGQTGLGKLIDKSPAQVSQWINGSPDSKTGKPRSMKSDTAREIEQVLGLPYAWFDQPLNDENSENNSLNNEGYIKFKLFDVKAAAGNGIINNDFPEPVRLIEVSEKWARKNIGRNLKSISIISANGDSMSPTFQSGDLLFVDEATKFYDDEGIYVFFSPSGLKVKRLCVMTTGDLKVISDNKIYGHEILKADAINSISICGKVVATLKIEKLS